MKDNSYLFTNSVQISYFLKGSLKGDYPNNKLNTDLSSQGHPPKKRELNFLNNLWKRLTTSPQSFPQTPNSAIKNMLEENTGKLAAGAIRRVLANKLGLSADSINLSKAIEESFEIYHEDYPYDFILEYKGERLGMFLLDKCFNSKGEAKLLYRFNPHIKSFRGVY